MHVPVDLEDVVRGVVLAVASEKTVMCYLAALGVPLPLRVVAWTSKHSKHVLASHTMRTEGRAGLPGA